MLQEGFHGSFKKFSSLLQRWKDERLAAGPDSELWLQRSLEEQPDKLEMLREHLTRAEAAQRAGDATDRDITFNSNVIGIQMQMFLFSFLFSRSVCGGV